MASKTVTTNATAIIRKAVISNPEVSVLEICELLTADPASEDVALSTIYATRSSTRETIRMIAELGLKIVPA